jgi:hypothetical protein
MAETQKGANKVRNDVNFSIWLPYVNRCHVLLITQRSEVIRAYGFGIEYMKHLGVTNGVSMNFDAQYITFKF